jgi:hypothetical protein
MLPTYGAGRISHIAAVWRRTQDYRVRYSATVSERPILSARPFTRRRNAGPATRAGVRKTSIGNGGWLSPRRLRGLLNTPVQSRSGRPTVDRRPRRTLRLPASQCETTAGINATRCREQRPSAYHSTSPGTQADQIRRAASDPSNRRFRRSLWRQHDLDDLIAGPRADDDWSRRQVSTLARPPRRSSL